MSADIESVTASARRFLETIPPHVILVAAAKGRSVDEVEAVLKAGVTHVGHNYVQEAQPIIDALGPRATWHMIGHLQRNKAKRAVELFDLIDTVDSLRLAKILDRHGASLGKTMQVMVEVNSGREASKAGVMPEDLESLVRSLSKLSRIRVLGLMTMGPSFGDPEYARAYFKETREALFRISGMNLPNITMRYLSMGMSNSFQVAIEEGANVVRIGTKLFGPRL